jgi:hypothetical protein
MIDPSLIAELEAEFNVASDAYEAGLKRVRALALSGRSGVRAARNTLVRLMTAQMRAASALERAKMGMG